LTAWKRLHEARKAAEVNGGVLQHIGLVESIAVHSAPAAALEGRTFKLGMRNIITGPNASGKSILTRLIASVAYPDHVADMSRYRDVDMGVRWFDPMTHDVATSGRAGIVRHVLDGRSVPYVARPYKTILLSGLYRADIWSLTSLAQVFDLNISAMRSTLALAADQNGMIKDVQCIGMHVRWTIDVQGRVETFTDHKAMSGGLQTLILLELAGLHARHHARVEPTFLLLDELLDFWHGDVQAEALQRLQIAAEHAQVAIVSHSPTVLAEASHNWTVTELAPLPQNRPDSPLAYDVATRPPDTTKP
jgi:hypothetical protein